MKKILCLIAASIIALPSYAGFLCKGKYAYGSTQPMGYITLFETSEKCQEAVDKSKNGFICKGKYLFNQGSKGSRLSVFQSAEECQDAVDKSKF